MRGGFMITYDDFDPNLKTNELAVKIKKDLVDPFKGQFMPNEIKKIIKQIFTGDRFHDKIYRRPLNEGDSIEASWSASLVQKLGQERIKTIIAVLNGK